jgi:hypothetical protein
VEQATPAPAILPALARQARLGAAATASVRLGLAAEHANRHVRLARVVTARTLIVPQAKIYRPEARACLDVPPAANIGTAARAAPSRQNMSIRHLIRALPVSQIIPRIY